jgi:hypothetical protein
MNNKNKSMGPTPITSRIKKTTKGGMTTQPLLNMGAPVKLRGRKSGSKKPTKHTTNMADFAVGSQERRNEYKKRGWRQDASTLAIPKDREDIGNVGRNTKQREDAYRDRNWAQDASSSVIPEDREYIGMFPRNSKARAAEYKRVGWKPDVSSKPTNYSGDIDGGGYPHHSQERRDEYKKRRWGQDTTTTMPTVKSKPKPYTKKGGKATGNMKDYKIGSQKRRDEYTARGWKQDDTTKVKKTVAVDKKSIKPVITLQTKKPVANVKIKAGKIKPGAVIRKQSKINKKLSQAAEARSNGNEKKALRKEKAAGRKAARLAKKKK